MLARPSIRIAVLCWLCVAPASGAPAQDQAPVEPAKPSELVQARSEVLAKAAKAKTTARKVMPHPGTTHMASSLKGMHALVKFRHSPFPYDGAIPGAEPGLPETAFYTVDSDHRRFHVAPRGGKLYEDQAYNDPRSFLYIPSHFDPSKPVTIVLFLHGNLAKLERDVVNRQHVPQQLEASGLNAVLVAPQLAVDALDSSAGNFWTPGFLEDYLNEAATRLEDLSNGGVSAKQLRESPVVIVAYSGGYLSTAYTLADTRNHGRIKGVILLDALFGEEPKFARWIEDNSQTTFFISAYSDASRGLNAQLDKTMGHRQIAVRTDIPASIGPGMVVLKAAPSSVHNDFVTQAWVRNPLQVLLKSIDRGASQPPPDGTSPDRADPSPNHSPIQPNR